jgi:hypothetical protein
MPPTRRATASPTNPAIVCLPLKGFCGGSSIIEANKPNAVVLLDAEVQYLACIMAAKGLLT